MSRLSNYLTESKKPKALNELFIQFNEIVAGKKGKELDAAIARLAMIAELDAANLYEQMIPQVSDREFKLILQDIADEEKVHTGEFEYFLDKFDPEWEDSEDDGEEEAEDKTSEGREFLKGNEKKKHIKDIMKRINKNKKFKVIDRTPKGYGPKD
jgi:rubrerythrin